MASLGLQTFFIAIAAGLLVLMVLYVAYAGGRRAARGQSGRLGSMRGGRRAEDAETGNGTARRHCRRSLESVDTLPRYTPAGEGEGGVAPPEPVHGSGEHERVAEGEEGVEPPPYSVDAGGEVAGEAGYDGDASEWPRGERHVGLPVSPDPVHVCG